MGKGARDTVLISSADMTGLPERLASHKETTHSRPARHGSPAAQSRSGRPTARLRGADSSRLGHMSGWPKLSLPEWTVLAVVNERPTHGSATAQLTARQGEIGRIWESPRAVIDRAIGGLLDAGLLVPGAVE